MASYINLGNGGFPAPAINPYYTSGTVNVGDVVYLASSLTVARADADNASARPPIGIVTGVSDGTASVAGSGSVASGLSGLTPGAVYWLSTTAGQMTTTQPGSNAYVIGTAISTTQLLVGSVPASLTGSTTPTFTTVTTGGMTVTDQGTIALRESSVNGTNTTSLRAGSNLSQSYTLTFPDLLGNNGDLLTTDPNGNLSWTNQPLLTQVSLNSLVVLNQGLIYLREASINGNHAVRLAAPNSLSSDYTLTLPTTAGTNGQFLTTNGSGDLSWSTGGGSGSVNVIEFNVNTAMATDSSTSIPSGARPLSVTVQVNNVYTPTLGNATILIGTSVSSTLLMGATDNSPTNLGIYTREVMNVTWPTTTPVRVSIQGSPSSGSCRVRVVYATTIQS